MERLIFDAHAHYDDEKFDNDRDEVLGSLPEKGVFGVINNGTDYKTSLQSIEFAEKYPYIYAAVGIHPNSVTDIDKNDIDKEVEKIAELLQHKKVVAIGETGLDYYWDLPKEEQHIVFEKQLILANKLDMPVNVHDREAHGDVLEYLRKYKPKGILHSFSGSVEMVLETDCPYLSPVPFRGKRNHSGMITYTAEKIAEIKNISAEEVLKATCENAKKVYNIE